MNFGQIQTRFEERTDESVEATKKKAYLNLAYQEIAGFTDLWPFLKKSSALTFTNGVATLPSDFSKPIKLLIGSTYYDVVAYQDRGQSGLTNRFYIVPPSDNSPVSTQIGILSASSTSGTLEYERLITELSADSDTPIFNPKFHELIVLGGLKRYHATERESSEIALVNAEYTNMFMNMVDFYLGKDAIDQSIGMQTLAQQYNFNY